MNEEAKNIKKEEKEKRQFFSFSTIDEKGNFREVYGYIEKDQNDIPFDERIEQMTERIKKGKTS